MAEPKPDEIWDHIQTVYPPAAVIRTSYKASTGTSRVYFQSVGNATIQSMLIARFTKLYKRRKE